MSVLLRGPSPHLLYTWRRLRRARLTLPHEVRSAQRACGASGARVGARVGARCGLSTGATSERCSYAPRRATRCSSDPHPNPRPHLNPNSSPNPDPNPDPSAAGGWLAQDVAALRAAQ
eukprot:scaffold3838_cov65-Phaeocystis_antarctica.AAC.9